MNEPRHSSSCKLALDDDVHIEGFRGRPSFEKGVVGSVSEHFNQSIEFPLFCQVEQNNACFVTWLANGPDESI